MVKASGTSSRVIADADVCLSFRATLAAGLLLLAVAPSTWAQQAPTANASNASAGQAALQEIVVTAEKRSETVQSTPMSVTAYSGAQLQAAGISDMSEVGYETPGISERNSGPGPDGI